MYQLLYSKYHSEELSLVPPVRREGVVRAIEELAHNPYTEYSAPVEENPDVRVVNATPYARVYYAVSDREVAVVFLEPVEFTTPLSVDWVHPSRRTE